MIICDAEQGTDQWFLDRAGVITGSMFAEVRKRLSSGARAGDFTKAARDYAFKLAVERISGTVLDAPKFDTWQMKRGRVLEEDARLLHENSHGILVEQVGLIKTDDGKFGASVDGLIGDDGASEYKCFIAPESLMPILLEDDFSAVLDQVQGGMWITGRQWSDAGLYCPDLESVGLDLTIKRIYRDDDYINELERDLWEFDKLVESYRQTLIETKGKRTSNDAHHEPTPLPSAAGLF